MQLNLTCSSSSVSALTSLFFKSTSQKRPENRSKRNTSTFRNIKNTCFNASNMRCSESGGNLSSMRRSWRKARTRTIERARVLYLIHSSKVFRDSSRPINIQESTYKQLTDYGHHSIMKPSFMSLALMIFSLLMTNSGIRFSYILLNLSQFEFRVFTMRNSTKTKWNTRIRQMVRQVMIIIWTRMLDSCSEVIVSHKFIRCISQIAKILYPSVSS